MLSQLSHEVALQAAHALHPMYYRMVTMQFGWLESKQSACFFTSEAGPERLLVCNLEGDFMLLGDQRYFEDAIRDVLAFRVEPRELWPSPELKVKWAAADPPRRWAEFAAFGRSWLEILTKLELAIEAEQHPGDGAGAYFYWLEGAPRFADQVRHPCRMVEGLELFELMKQATHYDESGEYTKRCLKNGPSFVCEVNGQPVCWSCTHVNQMMGMIYTPEEHRRHGYAHSLAAFQIDQMLERDQLAACYVMAENTASRGMMAKLGAQFLPEPMLWRNVWLDGEVSSTARDD